MSYVEIRQATADDYDGLADVMFEAVRHGNSPYTGAQRKAWVPEPRRGDDWVRRLNTQTIFVAEKAKRIVGFMTLAEKGYIDFAYIRPALQGSGVFRQLYKEIEVFAIRNKVPRLWVHASLSAQPAFKAMGFVIERKEVVEIGEQSLQRFEMAKALANAKNGST